MKYVVIIPDGAADAPLAELDGLTPLEAARTPTLDRLAARGRVGTVATTPERFTAGSDVCSMCLLGYDPVRYHTGRAPIEAAALGLDLKPTDWIFRLNFVTVGPDDAPNDAGLMLDHSGGALTDDEGKQLAHDLLAHWRANYTELADNLDLVHGKSYRCALIDRSGSGYASVRTTEPHAIPHEPWRVNVPVPIDTAGGEGAQRLLALMDASRVFLEEHPINRAREARGLRPANMAWIWGQGTPTLLPAFSDVFGMRGAISSSVDLLTGLARCMGWDVLDVPGLTSYHDTDYDAQARATIDAIDRYDLVCAHIEAPDELSHQGDWRTKLESIESIDAKIIGPILAHLEATYGDPEADNKAEGWRVLVMPDHYTLCSTRKHDPTPVPFMISGAWVRSLVERRLTERDAAASDLHVDPGHELMEYFLRSGLPRIR